MARGQTGGEKPVAKTRLRKPDCEKTEAGGGNRTRIISLEG
jgi:hypothetical protein